MKRICGIWGGGGVNHAFSLPVSGKLCRNVPPGGQGQNWSAEGLARRLCKMREGRQGPGL